MDGRGRWMDNVFIERLWRSIKSEEIYLHEYRDIAVLAAGVEKWLHNHNVWRPHQALANDTPLSGYRQKAKTTNDSQSPPRAVSTIA